MKSLTRTLAILTILKITSQWCVYESNGCNTDTDPHCHPMKILNEEDRKPKVRTYDPYTLACPDWEGKENCCNQNTMNNLFDKFTLVDAQLGNPSNGCSICATNIKRFWCNFNCNPLQHTITNWESFRIIKDYQDPGGSEPYDVATANITFDNNNICDIYKSCKGVYFVKELGSMSSPLAFFNSLTIKGVQKGHFLMNITTMDNHPAKQSTTYTCDNVFTKRDERGRLVDPSGYPLTDNQGWCSCSNCAYNCSDIDFGKYLKEEKLSDGFDLLFFVQVSVVCIAALMIGLSKRLRDKMKNRVELRARDHTSDTSGEEADAGFEEAASLRLRERLLE